MKMNPVGVVRDGGGGKDVGLPLFEPPNGKKGIKPLHRAFTRRRGLRIAFDTLYRTVLSFTSGRLYAYAVPFIRLV